ncbi:hypothetical protein G9A89_009604 [Geosiphon pyriformis]|nr:hypothetical protein G9A89_009604 [Geosiphon pyriformis]
MRVCYNCETISTHLPASDAANVSNTYTSISNPDLSTVAASNISTTATNHLSTPINSNTTSEPSSNDIKQSPIQKDATSNHPESNQQLLTNTIPPATISNDKFLAAIFFFKLEKTTPVLLFSGATLEEKPITVIYMDARVDDHPIKLILNSGSTNSIITRQLMDQLDCRVDCAASACIITADSTTKTPIGEIDDFPFEINGLVTLIKVLEPLIELEEKEKKPTWEAYQVSWTEDNHSELLPILSWDDKRKKKEEEELT